MGRCSTPTPHPRRDYLHLQKCNTCIAKVATSMKVLPRCSSSHIQMGQAQAMTSPACQQVSQIWLFQIKSGDLRLGYSLPVCRCLHPHLPGETVEKTGISPESHSLILFRHFHYFSIFSQPPIISPYLRQVNPSPT